MRKFKAMLCDQSHRRHITGASSTSFGGIKPASKFIKRIHLKMVFIMMIFLFTCLVVNAQPDDNDEPPTNDVPVDGGASLLVIAGIGYGLRKIRELKKTVDEV